MIEELNNVEILNKVGGKFKLSALIQKRMLEILEGGRPLIDDIEGLTTIEIIVQEILQDKITIDDEVPSEDTEEFKL